MITYNLFLLFIIPLKQKASPCINPPLPSGEGNKKISLQRLNSKQFKVFFYFFCFRQDAPFLRSFQNDGQFRARRYFSPSLSFLLYFWQMPRSVFERWLFYPEARRYNLLPVWIAECLHTDQTTSIPGAVSVFFFEPVWVRLQ